MTDILNKEDLANILKVVRDANPQFHEKFDGEIFEIQGLGFGKMDNGNYCLVNLYDKVAIQTNITEYMLDDFRNKVRDELNQAIKKFIP